MYNVLLHAHISNQHLQLLKLYINCVTTLFMVHSTSISAVVSCNYYSRHVILMIIGSVQRSSADCMYGGVGKVGGAKYLEYITKMVYYSGGRKLLE